MKIKYYNHIQFLVIGLILIVMGGFIFSQPLSATRSMLNLFGMLFILIGVIRFTGFVLSSIFKSHENKPQKYEDLSNAVGNIVFGLIIINTPGIQLRLFVTLIGAYALFFGLILGVTYLFYLKDGVSGRLPKLILSLFYCAFGITFLLAPSQLLAQVFDIIALFLIFYGLMYIKEFLQAILPDSIAQKFKSRIRITMPVMFAAFLPKLMLNKIDEGTTSDTDTILHEFVRSEDADIEVFVHVTEKGTGMIGHVDICFEDELISYGNYDPASYRLFESIGEGVLFTANAHDYVRFVTKDTKKTLFGFGVKLTPQQKENVRKRIAEIKSDTYPWNFEDRENKDELYLHQLSESVSSRFYKFHRGKFKTYFVFTTNCVLLANRIMGTAGLDLLKINGIISPGTYYECLNREFRSGRSLVVSRNVYQNKE
ncbi:hypothetical protein G7062_10170 [Erysipelothrix sp. HDW6C]|uniref:HdeD family acid-resistance protein n=1 Tax=Erysipelothrix sp. HDW6C TaxID=2714930 RepID=UPI001408F0E2|nr:DUF308 domain-containing protein [Erysipelothrix sp. HDW6C]QIK70646.1 hypothetical protein G7062_10170 [Erysipelothrix sp. HDW6C]